ncbi:hypothetical protein [Rhodanobacter sp. C03]|uniref:hypothetical protein n=1 Tax=Rhodanobacter sp. C03 TaxID=1945858 RepID=UPI0009D23D38|nr:hypothetical protein [Rhodanobacter sp. C03]OOG52984.1 hypothetical protein B0E48_16800 [Rhodanobacter sp. C03]
MATITFTDIQPEHAEAVSQVFRLIKEGKECGEINEEMVRNTLGQHLGHFVSDPEAIQNMLEKWKSDRSTPLSWDFGSWIDALASAELLYQTIRVHPDGSGELSFEQLAWPSGGIEATEELIKIFGGRVASNSAA